MPLSREVSRTRWRPNHSKLRSKACREKSAEVIAAAQPISSMPDWARHITYALPPRYFIEIMRSVYLKATPVPELGLQYVLLAGFAVLANSVAALTCRKRQ